MKKILSIFLISVLCFSNINSQDVAYDALVEKITTRPYPQWFKDAKLGIFIHWGLYSVPSYGGKESYAEWYLRGLQTGDTLRTNFLKRVYGQDFTYKDLTSYFKAELFNPDQWTELFKRAGAKYVVLVSKHHDGYALWPSKYSRNWNSMDNGPKRDIVGELTESVKNSGLKMGLYYSLPEWNNPLHRWYTDPHRNIGTYVNTYMIPQFKELVSSYKPSLLFADGEWFNSAKEWHSAELINWFYNHVGDEAIVNNRWGGGLEVGFLTPEYSAGINVTDRPWAEVRGIGRSFGLNRNETLEAYGTSHELVKRFVETVANGGGMILNVGPGADGQIPLIQQERLVQLGNWLNINGEAIYGSVPYEKTQEEKLVIQERVDENIAFRWVRNSPMKGIKEDYFTVDWKGYLVAPKTSEYTIEAIADDRAIVYIEGKAILNQNFKTEGTDSEAMSVGPGKSKEGKIKLIEGVSYKIHVKYEEEKQNAGVTLLWSTEDLEKEWIPSSSFYQDKEATKSGIKGSYSSLDTYICYTQNNGNIYAISFEWPEDQLVLSIEEPSANSKITMLGLDRTLNWTYGNEKLVVDTSEIKYSELPSHDAWTFKIEGK
jgi:alpha-L-fucosidase